MPSERPLPEGWLPVLGMASLFGAFLILHHRHFFWGDEVLTAMLVSLPTPTRMLSALADQVDNSPPLYYLLAWGWGWIWGKSEFSLRLLSCLCTLGAFAVTWRTLRLSYPLGTAALGVTAAFCLSLTVVRQVREARAYGLFLLLASLALYLYARRAAADKPTWRLAGQQALVHAGLVLSHYFGLLYSGVFLMATVAADVRRRLFHLPLYIAVLLGWCAFLPWLGPMARHRQTASPYSWIPVPGAKDLLASFGHALPLALIFLAWWWVAQQGERFSAPSSGTEPASSGTLRVREDLNLLAPLLICLPPAVAWVVSRTVVSVFWERYFLPGTLGWAVVLSNLAFMWFPDFRQVSFPGGWADLRRKLPALLLAGQLTIPLLYAVIWPATPPPREIAPPGCVSLPVVVPVAVDFLERTYHSSKPERYYFLLDWEAAIARGNNRAAVDDYHAMAAVKRHFPTLRIMAWDDFLRQYDAFLVMDSEDYTWFQTRLKCNRGYQWEFLDDEVILVRKISSLSVDNEQ